MTELKPCPFCGGKAEIQVSKRWPDGAEQAVDGYTVVCQNLGCILGGDDEWWCDTEAEAIAAWNSRAERTCHDAKTRFDAWTCSECKCSFLLMFDDYCEPTLNVDGVASVPNYCPNCGCKVVDE